MTRLILPASLLLLAACSGGEDKSQPEDSAAISPLQKAERPAPAEMPEPAVDADLPDAAEETLRGPKPEPPATARRSRPQSAAGGRSRSPTVRQRRAPTSPR